MLNLKKTAVAVLAFGSSAVFAGTMGPVCTPGSVTVPCEHTAWDFGAQALYLQPSYSNYGYTGITLTDGVETFQNATPNWAWGFKLEGSYHFSTGNDLDINWYHFNNTSTHTMPDGSFDPFIDAFPANVAASLQSNWNAVNAEFGQHVDFGEFKKIRFHGGLQYARINTTTSVDGTNTAGTIAISDSDSSTYNGIGPRVGADMSYNWGNGFAMYANGAAAVLVGTSSFTRNFSPALDDVVTTLTGSTTKIVPELEAKLGATYTYAMAQGDLTLDAGWMWANYFNAQTFPTALLLNDQTDFGIQGPYIGLKWVGNVA